MCAPIFTAAFFTEAKTGKQSKHSTTDKGIKNKSMYTMDSYSAINMNKILPFSTTWMDLESIMFIEM